MAAGKYDMRVEQGETYQRAFRVKVQSSGVLVDYTGWTAAMQVRKSFSSPTAVLTCTTANGKLTVVSGNPDYNLMLTIHPADTTSLSPGDYVYDIELTNAGFVRKLLKGKFKLEPEVTKV